MKQWINNVSLRMRLTLLTTGIIICVAAALTLTSINRAELLVKSVPLELINYTQLESGNPVSVTVGEQTVPMSQVDLLTGSTTINQVPQVVDATMVSEAATIAVTAKASKRFATSSTTVMGVVIFCGMILTWFVAGRALKPVQDLKEMVGEINGNNLSKRVEGFQAGDEISQLASSFNGMLDKVEAAFTQQKEFSLNAAHELKTPLAAIRTNLEVLHLGGEPSLAEYQETCEVIGRNTDRLIDLVEDLLKLNAKQALSYQESIRTEELIVALQDELTPLIVEKEIKLVIHNQLPLLYGNYNLFYSGLFNLLENAIKYHHHGGQVLLDLEAFEDDGVITVMDNGPGMASEVLGEIFQPFYRVEQSRSRQIGGSGLGLALVKSIVEKHNGTISVHSELGKGSTFTMILPQNGGEAIQN